MNCPIPFSEYPHVLLAHGGGGRLMHQLIEKMFKAAFDHPLFQSQLDAALLPVEGRELAFTTDSYVVRPYFFPGGDIGSLAVHGTVNDLAMVGARPLYLSLALILEEGLPMEDLWRIVLSIKEAADRTGVRIVTGDTKVVNKGKGDGIFINTSGVGVLEIGRKITPNGIRPGDAVLINGDLGRHGMAIMAAREGLEFETELLSDSAPLYQLVAALLEAGISVHGLRDLTRGGLASVLVELAETAGMELEIEEDRIPVGPEVQGACEILGLDPLYVANEGRFVLFVPDAEAGRAQETLISYETGRGAVKIGTVREANGPRVVLKSRLGVPRILDRLSGEQLPRIC